MREKWHGKIIYQYQSYNTLVVWYCSNYFKNIDGIYLILRCFAIQIFAPYVEILQGHFKLYSSNFRASKKWIYLIEQQVDKSGKIKVYIWWNGMKRGYFEFTTGFLSYFEVVDSVEPLYSNHADIKALILQDKLIIILNPTYLYLRTVIIWISKLSCPLLWTNGLWHSAL